MRDDGIWVDVVWIQNSGSIFETKVIAYNGMDVVENLIEGLGEECEIEGQIFDLRTPSSQE